MERNHLEPFRRWADHVIDTTGLTSNALQQEIRRQFELDDIAVTTVTITSFGFSRGLPNNIDLLFDVRFLANPFWEPELKLMTGLDKPVAEYVGNDPAYSEAMIKIHRYAGIPPPEVSIGWKSLCEYRNWLHRWTSQIGTCGRGTAQKLASKGNFDHGLASQSGIATNGGAGSHAENGPERGQIITMIGLVLVTHGQLATEFITAMEHVVGKQKAIAAVCIGPHDDMEEKRAEIEKSISTVDDGAGVIVLSDLFGGTPSNLAISFLDKGKIEVIAGINLPMLIRLDGARRKMNVTDAVAAAQEAGQKYISVASEILEGSK